MSLILEAWDLRRHELSDAVATFDFGEIMQK